MRQFIIASHAHFAEGINESVELLLGRRENVRTVSMFVDGNDDVADVVRNVVEAAPASDELIVCTDLLGGSVNNEFVRVVQERRPDALIVTNMNLPLLLQLLISDEGEPAVDLIRGICASDETRVKFVNDLLADGEGEEEF